MSEPQTESGRARRDHDEAWAPDATEWHMNHRSDPDDCPGCDVLNDMLTEAASKAVAEVLDRLEARVAEMKACAPDGDYIRWDVRHADPELHYVNRSGVRALIASERPSETETGR